MPLNSQWETEMEINGKLCPILVDSRAICSTLSPVAWDPAGEVLGKVAEGGKGGNPDQSPFP